MRDIFSQSLHFNKSDPQPSFRIAACCGFVGSGRIRERTAYGWLRSCTCRARTCQPGQLRVGDQTKGFRRIEEAAAPEGFVG